MKISTQVLEYTELHKAKKKPGIYAWYAKPSIGEMDICHDDNFQSLINIIGGYMTAHHPPILDVRIEASFYHRWERQIDENSHKEWRSKLINEIRKLDELGFFKHEDAKKIIVEMFKATVPYIASPLYIGSTGNLYRRLDEHKRELDEVFILTRGGTNGIETNELDSFAKRAIHRRFRPANLMVWVIFIESESESESESEDPSLRLLCYFVEWVLNGCHAPKLGER